MSYDPETYWPERYRRQGETYVAKGGRRSSYDQQIGLIAPYFDWLPTPGRVLDFGCGPERFRPHLEAHGLTYFGYDLIPGLGTVDEIEPRGFDCAVAFYVLQHIVAWPAYRDAVREIQEALLPGGTLLVVDAYPLEEPFEHMKPRGPAVLCDEAGFVDSEFTRLDEGHWVGWFR